jgi:Lipocalin-like domain
MPSITVLGMSLLVGSAFGQQRSLTEQLLGTWTLISHESVRADGTRTPVYGVNPKGVAVFDAGGHFIITVMRADRAKYAIDFPTQGTAEENKATAQGTMTYFGTYSVDEADRNIALHIEASSFPNWNGADQKRNFAIAGDQLTLTARALQTGGYADVVWKRAK